MRVRRQIAGRPERREQFLKDLEVALGRINDLYARLVQPGLHGLEGLVHREGSGEKGGPRAQTKKGQQDAPLESYRFGARESSFKPVLGLAMLRGVFVDGIEQDVRVDQLHFRRLSLRASSSSSSAAAIDSALSSATSGRNPIR